MSATTSGIPLRVAETNGDPIDTRRLSAPGHGQRPTLWNIELNKFFGQDVEILTEDGAEIVGNLRALNHQTLACILMTEDHKILVPKPVLIQRKRTPRP